MSTDAEKKVTRAPKLYPIIDINGDTDVLYDVLIDTREQITRSGNQKKFTEKLIAYLEANNFTYKRLYLPVGDYIINRGKGRLIESKTVEDFVSSMTGEMEVGGNRLTLQLENMGNMDFIPASVLRCFIVRGALNIQLQTTLIEKKIKDLKSGPVFALKPEFDLKSVHMRDTKREWKPIRVHANSFVGFIEKVQRFARFIPLGDDDHVFDWFRLQLDKMRDYEKEVHKKVTQGETYIAPHASLRKVALTLTDDEKQQSVLEGFTKIGPKLATKLLREYKTLRNIFVEVTLEKLIDLGFPKPTATEFLRILDVEYHPQKEPKKS